MSYQESYEYRRSPFFERPVVRTGGLVVLAALVGVAVGNGWATSDALRGEGRWWQQACHQQVLTALQRHQEQDYEKYGR